jgi:hypothetical protein
MAADPHRHAVNVFVERVLTGSDVHDEPGFAR